MTNKNIGDQQGSPDIVIAAYNCDSKLVASLLNEGHDPNSVDSRDNLSLLHIACMHGDEALVQVLLDWDARHGTLNFEVESKHRPRQAWQYAANANFLEIAGRVHDAGLAKMRASGPRLG